MPGRFALRIIGLAGVALTAGCATLQRAVSTVATATVTLTDVSGAPRGTAALRQDMEGIVYVQLRGVALPAGTKGIHFHAVGRCDNEGAGAFATAGPHFNPESKRHGLSSVDGPHAGDMPNIVVRDDGTVGADLQTDRVTLTEGSRSLFDADGSALIIHAGPDDQITDPSGNSGARIACGVVRVR
ncbi:superoxide dismutase family protein [soil metagenome]